MTKWVLGGIKTVSAADPVTIRSVFRKADAKHKAPHVFFFLKVIKLTWNSFIVKMHPGVKNIIDNDKKKMGV